MPRFSLPLLLVGALLAGCAAGPPEHKTQVKLNPATAPPLEASLFEAFRPLGDGQRDVALAEVERTLDTMLAMRRKAIRSDAVNQLFDRVRENIDEVGLEGLLELMPGQPDEAGAKEPVLVGIREGERYRLELGEPGQRYPRQMGEYVTSFRMVPDRRQEDFRLDLTSAFRLHLGDLGPQELQDVIHEVLRWVELAALEGWQPNRRTPRMVPLDPDPMDEDADRPPLPPPDPEDRAVLRHLAASLPHVFPKLTDLLRIKDVVYLEERGGTPVTQVRLIVSPDMRVFEERYPLIYDYLLEAKTMRQSRFVLEDRKGRPFLEVAYDGPRLEMRIRAAILNGRLIPLTGPDLDPAVDPHRRGVQDLTGRVDFKLRFWGLTFRMEDMELPVLLEQSQTTFSRTIRLERLPRTIEVTGALWGVFPVWLVDLLIPSNLEKITRNFMKTLIRGDNGRGMQLEYRFEQVEVPNQGPTNLYSALFNGMLADNGFVQFQAALVKERMAPAREARSEMGDVFQGLVEALEADLNNYKEQIGATAQAR